MDADDDLSMPNESTTESSRLTKGQTLCLWMSLRSCWGGPLVACATWIDVQC